MVRGGQESGGCQRRTGQELATASQVGLPGAVGQEAEVPNAHEVRGDDMPQEAAEEFLGPQFHRLGRAPTAVVFIPKAHHAVADEDQALVGNGHSMGVAAEVLQHLFRAAPGRLGVDDPGALL